ncbi:MAG: TonB-dependent receptor [Bacteroidales bacterium]|nr:TonB-dependent receptor [Bacteroidales bacterium]
MRKVFLLGLFLLLIPFSILAQDIKVTGKVLDGNTNEALIGVNVVQSGTTNGTVTDLDGKFEITVPSDSKLQFSYIGYVAQTIDVAGKTTIICTLATDDKEIEQVVVVGYGTMKKSDVSGSVVSVNTDDMMKRSPANVNQGLQGAAAGVMVTAQDGSPEGKSQVRIRGVATINGNAQPLYVVDGIQVGTDANFLNPADIESMEVLKDASATAIYGAAGANGVIMITTKHGTKGKARFDFSADFGVQTLAYELDVLDVDQYAAYIRTAHANDKSTFYNDIWKEEYDGKRTPINWQRQLTDPAFKQQYNVSVSGGNDKSQTQFSASYLKADGLIVNSAYERLTSRVNNKTKVTDFLELGGDLNFVYSTNHGSNGTLGNNGNLSSQRDLAYMSPSMDYITDEGYLQHVNVVNSNGTYGLGTVGENANEFMAERLNNPYAMQMENNSKNKNTRVLTSAYAQINIIKGLTFKSVVAFNYNSSNWDNFQYIQKRANVGIDGNYYVPEQSAKEAKTNSFSLSQSQYFGTNIENYFNYTWKNDIMNLSAMIGQEASNSNGAWVSASTQSFKEETMRDISLSDDVKNGSGGFNAKVRGVSYFGRFTYSLFDKYVVTGTVRRDGSSNFGKGNRFGTFPSAALAWRISQEDFLKDNEIINNLKLRLGWGQTGNSGGATSLGTAQTSMVSESGKQILYAFYQPYGGMGLWGNGVQTTTSGVRIVNVDENLKWETNEQTNIGIDLGLLGGQVNITADYFIRKSKDLLLQRALPASSGMTKLYTNYGEIENKGFEFMVNYQKRIRDWNFNASLTASTLKNKVKKMGEPQYFTNDGGANDPACTNASSGDGSNQGCIGAASGYYWGDHSITKEGYAVGSYYGYVVEGIFQSKEEIEALARPNKNPDGSEAAPTQYQYACVDDGADERTLPGDFKYKDLDGDGQITENDREIIGNGFPKFNYGINLSAAYKNWDLSIYGYGVAGLKLASYSAMRLSSGYLGDDGCVPNTLADNSYWSPDNTGADLPRITMIDGNHNRRLSTAWIKKADYFKISNIQIGYTFDRNLISKLQMTNARVYFSVSNVALFSKYKKYGDPECGQGCVLFTGLDSGRYPNPRTYQFGVSFSF